MSEKNRDRLVRAGVASAAIGAGGLAVAYAGPRIGQGLSAIGQGAGEGLGTGLDLTMQGAGAGAGAGTRSAGEGLAAGLQPLLLPLLVLAAIVLLPKLVR